MRPASRSSGRSATTSAAENRWGEKLNTVNPALSSARGTQGFDQSTRRMVCAISRTCLGSLMSTSPRSGSLPGHRQAWQVRHNELLDRRPDGAGGVVAAMGLAKDQRAFDQGRKAVGKGFGCGGVGAAGAGQVAALIAGAPPIFGGSLMDRVVRVGKLGGGVHEHAAVEFGIIEPKVHHVQHG